MTSGAAERLDFVEQALLASGRRLDFFLGSDFGVVVFWCLFAEVWILGGVFFFLGSGQIWWERRA